MTIAFTNVAYELMIDNFSKTISRSAVTKTTSNMTGDESLSYGTPANISGAFYRKEDSWMQDKMGLLDGADAVLMVKDDVTINKDDKLTYDGEEYLVDKVVMRRLGTITFYKAAQCFKNG